MHEICCKLSGTKMNVIKGEPCIKFKECSNSSICGAIEPIKRTQYGGKILGNNYHRESKEVYSILTKMEWRRNRSSKWLRQNSELENNFSNSLFWLIFLN